MTQKFRCDHPASLKLFLEDEREDYYAEPLYEDLLTADWAAKATYYRELFNLDAITSAEIRQRENLNPYAASVGDLPMLNGAYQPLEDLGRGRLCLGRLSQGLSSGEQRGGSWPAPRPARARCP